MRLLFLALLAGAVFGASAHAGEIAWGEPDHGLRLGIVRSAQDAPYHQPRFDLVIENVSNADLTLPDAGSYMEKTGARGSKFRATPLAADVLNSSYSAARQSSTRMHGTIDEIADFILKPGETRKFEAMGLQGNWYRNAPAPAGENKGSSHWSLLPDSTNTVVFYFENQQHTAAGRELWMGKAVSGKLTVITPPASLEGFNLEAGFSLPKQDYFIGEPIYAEFRVTNKGDKAVGFPTGGDYRGTGRHERFKIVATDETGKALSDPVLPSGMGGGLGSTYWVKPGESYSEQVFINLWGAMTKPGHYALSCRRILNLTNGDADRFVHEELLPTLPVQSQFRVNLIRDDESKRKLIEALPGMLHTHDAESAREQMYALALAQDEDVLLQIEQVIMGQNPYTQEGVWWLRNYRNPETKAKSVLVRIAHSQSPAHLEAIRVLTYWPVPVPEILDVIKTMLKSTDVQDRSLAVQACGSGKYPACFKILLAMGNDLNPSVRAYVGEALGSYNDKRALPVLLKLLRDPAPNDYTRMMAAKSLDKLGRKDGIPVLIDLLKPEKNSIYDDNIVRLLVELSGEKLKPGSYDQWHDWWEREGKAKFSAGMGELTNKERP